jgi:hypothetical protein
MCILKNWTTDRWVLGSKTTKTGPCLGRLSCTHWCAPVTTYTPSIGHMYPLVYSCHYIHTIYRTLVPIGVLMSLHTHHLLDTRTHWCTHVTTYTPYIGHSYPLVYSCHYIHTIYRTLIPIGVLLSLHTHHL